MSELSKQYHSIYIDDKNTWENWHMVPTFRPLVNPPGLATEYVSVPGMDGDLDYTEVLAGKPVYKNREGSWEFVVLNGYQEWDVLYNELLAFLHGKTHTVILEDEPDYEYEGRLVLNEWRSEEHNSYVVVDYILSPYKKYSSLEASDWKWDSLTINPDYYVTDNKGNKVLSTDRIKDSYSGYIIYYGRFDIIDIENGKSRNIYNPTDHDVEISLFTTGNLEVERLDKGYSQKYNFSAGSHEKTGIILSPGNNGGFSSNIKTPLLIFRGAGRVTVSYDRGEMI